MNIINSSGDTTLVLRTGYYPTSSIDVVVELSSGDTYKSGIASDVSASWSDNILTLNAGIYIEPNEFYSLMVWSKDQFGQKCQLLYRGEILNTSLQPYKNDSLPYTSYEGNTTEYITYS